MSFGISALNSLLMGTTTEAPGLSVLSASVTRTLMDSWNRSRALGWKLSPGQQNTAKHALRFQFAFNNSPNFQWRQQATEKPLLVLFRNTSGSSTPTRNLKLGVQATLWSWTQWKFIVPLKCPAGCFNYPFHTQFGMGRLSGMKPSRNTDLTAKPLRGTSHFLAGRFNICSR